MATLLNVATPGSPLGISGASGTSSMPLGNLVALTNASVFYVAIQLTLGVGTWCVTGIATDSNGVFVSLASTPGTGINSWPYTEVNLNGDTNKMAISTIIRVPSGSVTVNLNIASYVAGDTGYGVLVATQIEI